MAKFIELHMDGDPILVNLDYLAYIDSESGADELIRIVFGSNGIIYKQNALAVDESYEKIRMMIASAQGGIPMEEQKMY